MSDEKSKNRGGRPPKSSDGNKSITRTFRVRSSLDARLNRAADEAVRSLSEEIEYRLMRSFDRDDDEGDLLGGSFETLTLLRMIKAAITSVEAASGGESWALSPDVRFAVGVAIYDLVGHFLADAGGVLAADESPAKKRAEEVGHAAAARVSAVIAALGAIHSERPSS